MKINKITPFIILLIALTSCIKTLELDAEKKTPKLVVNSIFESGKAWEVHVSNSLSVLDRGRLENVTDATVKVIEESGSSFILQHFSDGIYKPLGLTSGILEGKVFQIEVSAPGYETVTSENFCPRKTIISSVTFKDSENKLGFDAVNREIKIRFKDRAGEENYYLIELDLTRVRLDTNSGSGKVDTLIIGNNISSVKSVHPFVDDSRSDFEGQFITFNDKLFDGKSQEISFSSYIYSDFSGSNHTLNKVNLYTVTKETYLYFKSMNAYFRADGNPFAEPIQVFSNIENGFGIFSGKSNSDIVFLK